MNQVEIQRPMPGSETQHNAHIRCLSVVPVDLKALLEQLEAAGKSEAKSDTETK